MAERTAATRLPLPHQHVRAIRSPVVYRANGTHGPLTWKNAAVIGMPYGPDDGSVPKDAVDLARLLLHLGVGCWIRPDASAWYPGWTKLTLAAPGLLHLDPAAFGFLSVVEDLTARVPADTLVSYVRD